EGVALRETFRKIESVAVYLVLFDPVFDYAACEISCGGRLVVEVVADVEIVPGRDVEPGVVWCYGAIRPTGVHPHQWRLTERMVQHDVEDHGKPPFGRLVDKALEGMLGAVEFVESDMERRIVSPAHVALKFVHRHKLDGVDAKSLQVVEGVGEGFVASGG